MDLDVGFLAGDTAAVSHIIERAHNDEEQTKELPSTLDGKP